MSEETHQSHEEIQRGLTELLEVYFRDKEMAILDRFLLVAKTVDIETGSPNTWAIVPTNMTATDTLGMAEYVKMLEYESRFNSE